MGKDGRAESNEDTMETADFSELLDFINVVLRTAEHCFEPFP